MLDDEDRQGMSCQLGTMFTDPAAPHSKCLSEEFLNHMNHLCSKSGGLIRGGVTDVDEQEPRPL